MTPAEVEARCDQFLSLLETGDADRVLVVDGGRVIAVARRPDEEAPALQPR